MNVLLVSCYELGHQPLGLASPAVHLRAAGVSVECLDLAVEPIDEAAIRRADLVGISIPMHTAARLGVRVGRRVRELNPDAHVCFYGLYASPNADYLLDAGADSVIGGEYEGPLVELVQQLAGVRGDPPAGGGDGTCAADATGPPLVGIRTEADDTDPFLGRQRFMVPARDLLPPLERYAHLETPDGARKPVGYVEASRGCAHRCRHCPIPSVYEGRLRIVQQDVVLADIEQLVEMGARHITFGDPDFLNGVKHSMPIVRRMHEAFPELTFDATIKVEHLLEHRRLVPELERLGCAFIVSAVESLNDRILGYLDKGHTAADVEEALRITRRAGVPLRPTFVPFTPWTTLDDYLRILEFVEAHGLIHHVDPVQYSIRLLLPPGSWLLDVPEIRPHVGELDASRFVHRWAHPDAGVDALQQRVADVVERAAGSGEDARTTFYRVKSMALAALAGRGSPAGAHSDGGERGAGAGDDRPVPEPAPDPVPAPRLTESWFC